MSLRISPFRSAGRLAARGVLRGQNGQVLRAARLSTSTKDNCLSVGFNPANTSKQQVIEAITAALSPSSPSQPAAVLLASKTLAPWLHDQSFLSHLLSPFQTTSQSPLILLSAAVDYIPHLTPTGSYSPSEGLSLLSGSLPSILPGFQPSPSPEPPHSQAQPSLTFNLPPLPADSRPLHLTLPLANTVFTTGSPSTIFSTTILNGKFTSFLPQTSQIISLPNASTRPSNITLPLVPITEPRKILAGLGNILRQTEVDLRPMPASKELEDIIPRLLKAREEMLGGQGHGVGPMSVWAVVYPGEVASQGELPRALKAEEYGVEEWKGARRVSGVMERFMGAGGHVRRILSGGGGWGLKQGLLSLDPQTKYATEEAEDVESFIRSFNGEEKGGATVAPGSWVQFMVEPVGKKPEGMEVSREVDEGGCFVVGTPGGVSDGENADGVRVQRGLFGAVSAEGIYVASEKDSEGQSVTTKLDSAGAFVLSRF